jgi:NAD(P)-dependent dehydrogenase (short-subunit alcohol dehydrogenase family)
VGRGAALVTGSARRIGRTIALKLAEAGFDIAVHHHRSADDAAEVVRLVEDLGRRATALAADLSVESGTAALVDQATAALGPMTLLVNNASVFNDDRAETHDRAGWDAHMNTNLRAPVLLTQRLAAALPPDREGCVVNILDQRVRRLNPQFFSYTLSKAALWTATRTLAQALAPRIRVNGVGPGPTLASIHQAEGEFEAEAANVPLQLQVTAEEVAAAVLYLADARSVTGQMIAVDAGQHLAWRTPDVVAD